MILKIELTRLTFRTLPEKLLPFLPDTLFVTIDATAELDRCVSIACRALEVVAELSVLHGYFVAAATTADRGFRI